jgi:hypothetical protein
MDTLDEKFNEDAKAIVEFEKMRFELAWRHFEFHARQRTTMFHFFIILAPFLFGGCFILFKDREILGAFPPIIAAGVSSLLAFIFYLLDERNKQLYDVSKGALSLLEQQLLFTSFRPLKVAGANYEGVLTTEAKRYGQKNLIKHGLLMGAVYWLAIAMFALLTVYFLAVRQGCIKLPIPSSIASRNAGH